MSEREFDVVQALESSLAVDPSAEFSARVRQRVGVRRRAAIRFRFAAALLAACGAAVAVVSWPSPSPSAPRVVPSLVLRSVATTGVPDLQGAVRLARRPAAPTAARAPVSSRPAVPDDRLVVQTSQPGLMRRMWAMAKESGFEGASVAAVEESAADPAVPRVPASAIRVDPIRITPIIVGSVFGDSAGVLLPAIPRIRRQGDAAQERNSR